MIHTMAAGGHLWPLEVICMEKSHRRTIAATQHFAKSRFSLELFAVNSSMRRGMTKSWMEVDQHPDFSSTCEHLINKTGNLLNQKCERDQQPIEMKT